MKAGHLLVLATATAALSASLHAAQPSYPAKPIRLVMPYPAGGPTDILGRIIAQRLGDTFGTNVIIDNKPGGAGMIGATIAAKAAPDGYTLYLGGITTLAIAPFVQKSMPYDPIKDFSAITQTTISPLLLMVHPSVQATTVKEFLALVKAKPGQINYASSGPGGSGHLAGELFKTVTGTNLVHVPYRGAPPALNDLVAGQVQTMFGTMLAAVPHVRTGKVRAIAVTGPKRSIAVPEVPTFAEGGLPTYDASSWNGVLAPTGTPKAIVDRLHVEIAKILHTPNVLDRLAGDGPIPVGNTPKEFSDYIKSEQTKWSKVIRLANIQID